jgi:aspartokinase-like uncharacterized kinase
VLIARIRGVSGVHQTYISSMVSEIRAIDLIEFLKHLDGVLMEMLGALISNCRKTI